jgi:hypothetical protein
MIVAQRAIDCIQQLADVATRHFQLLYDGALSLWIKDRFLMTCLRHQYPKTISACNTRNCSRSTLERVPALISATVAANRSRTAIIVRLPITGAMALALA